MSANFSDDFNNELHDTFKMLDTDDEGKISGQKLLLGLKAHGFDQDPRIIERASKPQSIDLKEFMSIVLMCSSSTTTWMNTEVNEIHDLFDKDGHKCFGVTQVKRFLGRLGEKISDLDMEDQFQRFDNLNEHNMMDAVALGKIVAKSNDDK
jgi:Ca2+-binding EF-hand superfamily protein